MSYQRKYRYGLSEPQFLTMLVLQDSKCPICKMDFDKDKKSLRPHVDHCHDTNEIRGLLCLKCNAGIGQLGDSIPRLEAAIEYIAASGA